MKAYVGIDVSKKWLDMALWVDGEIVEQLQLDYNRAEVEVAVQELNDIVGKRELIFGCEATGQYHKALVYQLHELGYRQKVINPRMTHHEKMARNISSGNDAIEAVIIAQHLAMRDDPFWKPEHEGNSALRDLVLRRDQLKKELNREKNRLDRFTVFGPAEKSLKRGIKFIEKELEIIEEEIKKVIDEDGQMQEDMELLRTIPGVGYYTSLTFLARIGDVSRFNKADEVVKYLGLAPIVKKSGSSINKARLSKTGDTIFRSTVFNAALVNTNKDNYYGKYYRSLVERGKNGRTALTGVMRKITRAMFAILRDRRPFSINIYGNSKIALTA